MITAAVLFRFSSIESSQKLSSPQSLSFISLLWRVSDWCIILIIWMRHQTTNSEQLLTTSSGEYNSKLLTNQFQHESCSWVLQNNVSTVHFSTTQVITLPFFLLISWVVSTTTTTTKHVDVKMYLCEYFYSCGWNSDSILKCWWNAS